MSFKGGEYSSTLLSRSTTPSSSVSVLDCDVSVRDEALVVAVSFNNRSARAGEGDGNDCRRGLMHDRKPSR